ncbi:unnamed protein product [Nesidiocoris tenuis]|uniref:Uncharacterized protein n=1 Tax=Nesidiocoris tenuis TaxID=355587 RepID=A0A6H5H7T5_9HEMI|nr:unnamed protein product [Nesidiocoris tenuis]
MEQKFNRLQLQQSQQQQQQYRAPPPPPPVTYHGHQVAESNLHEHSDEHQHDHHHDHHDGEHHHTDYYSPPHYDFEYSVHDGHTGDFKSAHESREGDVVKGYYTVKEADGTTREVHYQADHKNGFTAEVKRSGHTVHSSNPQPSHHHHHHQEPPKPEIKSQISYHHGSQPASHGHGPSYGSHPHHGSYNSRHGYHGYQAPHGRYHGSTYKRY